MLAFILKQQTGMPFILSRRRKNEGSWRKTCELQIENHQVEVFSLLRLRHRARSASLLNSRVTARCTQRRLADSTRLVEAVLLISRRLGRTTKLLTFIAATSMRSSSAVARRTSSSEVRRRRSH